MTSALITRRLALLGLASSGTAAAAADGSGDSQARKALAALEDGGTVALIRHAQAPGVGDPPGLRLGDCSTQRNLSDEGRRQAAALGQRLRAAGVLVTEVMSSRWCRTLDTARLAFPDVPTTPFAALDSILGDPSSGPGHTAQVLSAIRNWRGRHSVLALVTHQVNIAALAGIDAGPGEIVVVRPDIAAGLQVVGRASP